jgi:Protein of unknown function (DUF3500)
VDAAEELASVVGEWLATLDPVQRDLATFRFDDAERFVWDYRPGDRAGLSLAAMSGPQRAGATAILDRGLSRRGAAEVAAIIALEPILGAIERAAGAGATERRDPERYWFSVFGEPGSDAPWSWRVGGHHVALQQTVVDGTVVAPPAFLGANPAVIPSGPRQGERTLAGEEALARSLLDLLGAAERRIALVDPVAPPDIRSGIGRRATVDGIPFGIRRDALDGRQQDALDTLVRHYLGRHRDEVAAAAWDRLAADGLHEVTFGWAGPVAPGRGHYYAVRGPSFLLEYDNTQNGANHIHAVWRDLVHDWGEDALAAHYRGR